MGPDMMNSCRICLMENNIMIPIFGEDGQYRKIREMIRDSLNIALFQADPLPRKICCKCYFKLQQACQLKADCQRSTKVFINHLNGQRSPEAIRTVKTLNHQLQILHGNATMPQGNFREPEMAGPSRGVIINHAHAQTIRPAPPITSPSNEQQMRNVFRVMPSGRMKFKLRKPSVPCAVCGKLFLSKKSASAHMHKNHSVAEVNKLHTTYKCSICLRGFETLVGLNLHRHRNHRLPPFNAYSRPQPNRNLLQSALLQPQPQQQQNKPQHQQIRVVQIQPKPQVQMQQAPTPTEPEKSGDSSVTHECGLCFRICKSEGTLRMHIAQVHKNVSNAHAEAIQNNGQGSNAEPTASTSTVHENLQCSLCYQPFRNVNGLVGHLRTAHGKPSCAICLEIFPTQEELNAHRQTHKPGYTDQQVEKRNMEIFSCPICGKSFDNATSLSRHKGYHTKMGPNWTPSDISTTTSTVSSPNSKITPTSRQSTSSSFQDDQPRKVFACHICGKKFDNNLSLARHRASHAKYGYPQRSLIPPQRQVSPSKPAMEDYEPEDKKPLLNDEGKIVDRVSMQKLKSNATSIPFCLYCKKIYDSQDKLWEHICSMHPNDPRYRCQEQDCLRVFFSGTGFRSHQTAQGHNAPPETANSNKSVESGPSLAFLGAGGSNQQIVALSSSKCQICMRRFSNTLNLRRHMKMAHRTSTGTSLLRVHPNTVVNTYSRKVTRVLCRYCPKYLSSKYISEHEKMHRIRGDKPSGARDNGGPPPEAAQDHHVMPEEEDGAMEVQVDVEEDDEQEDNPINSLPDSITVTQNPEFKLHRKQPREPVCKYCSLKASNFFDLREHLDTHHPGLTYHVCEGCPEIYYDRKTLVSHNIVHSRVYHRCKYCTKSFARPLALRGHENRCLFLQKKQGVSMEQDMQVGDVLETESGGYSYTCEFCSEKFNDSMSFVQHLQTHAT